MSEFDTQLAALTAANASLQTAIEKMNSLMTASETADVTIGGQNKPSISKQVAAKSAALTTSFNQLAATQTTEFNALADSQQAALSDFLENVVPTEIVETRINAMGGWNYTGRGEKYPLFVDNNFKMLLWYNTETGKIEGEIASSSGAYKQGVSTTENWQEFETQDVWNHIILYGQSLSVGAAALPVVTTSPVYSCLTFASGTRGAASDLSAVKGLYEDNLAAPDGGTNRGETPCSGLASELVRGLAKTRGVLPEWNALFLSTAGNGGYRVSQLQKGTVPYARLLSHITAARSLATTAQKSHNLAAVCWIQGENDAILPTSYETYQTQLRKLIADIVADSGETPLFCSYQMSYETLNGGAAIAQAQLDMCKSGEMIMSTPMYHLPYASDKVHLTAIGSKWLGSYFGLAITRHKNNQKTFIDPLSAIAISSMQVDITFSAPMLPLVIDDAMLSVAVADAGFAVTDSVGVVTIASVQIPSAGNVVSITLGRALSGAAVVTYALSSELPYVDNGAGGIVRDSGTDTCSISGTTYPLYSVCPHFTLPIIQL